MTPTRTPKSISKVSSSSASPAPILDTIVSTPRSLNASDDEESVLSLGSTASPAVLHTNSRRRLPVDDDKDILETIVGPLAKVPFYKVCNERVHVFGLPNSTRRKACQNRRDRLLKILQKKPSEFLALCNLHGVVCTQETLPRRQTKPSPARASKQEKPAKKTKPSLIPSTVSMSFAGEQGLPFGEDSGSSFAGRKLFLVVVF